MPSYTENLLDPRRLIRPIKQCQSQWPSPEHTIVYLQWRLLLLPLIGFTKCASHMKCCDL